MARITDVYNFQLAAGEKLQHNPRLLAQAVAHCKEELSELTEAYEAFLFAKDPSDTELQLLNLIDAVADLRYVALNVLFFLGVPAVVAIADQSEVHAANMCKLAPKPMRDATGKLLKPLGWVPPAHTAVKEWLAEHPFGGKV